ncbi:MAG: OmpA family protein [Bacteroidetes bacterium]|nr:OmpA family protein [Bacteroidota bacterium]
MRVLLSGVLCLCMVQMGFAQNKDYKWQIGVGMHGPQFTINDDFFWSQNWRLKDWNITPPISKLSVSRHITGGLSPELSYSIGKIFFQPQIDKQEHLFMDIDLNAKYSFANGYILKTKSWFDPYLIAGVGATFVDKIAGAHWFFAINYGMGLNLWFEKNVGLNIQTIYNKLPGAAMQVGSGGNVYGDYMHHSAGLVFRFGGKNDKDGDGIADEKDACPEVAGIEALKGCPDKDGDGIGDKEDACPDQVGVAALLGCPDRDGDGIGDKDDACPGEAGLKELNGCPDKDKDGIADKDDACPDVAGMVNLKGCPDKDGDGYTDADDDCPEVYGKVKGCPDTDGDGIEDSKDNCPKEAGLVELKGCPKQVMKEEEKKEVEKKIATLAKSINFETGKDVIKKESFDELDQVVVFMNQYSGVNFKIEGHTDNVGEDAKNLELSKKRAQAVKDYFISKGIATSRLSSEGFGSANPKADNKLATGRAINRRVDITINQ